MRKHLTYPRPLRNHCPSQIDCQLLAFWVRPKQITPKSIRNHRSICLYGKYRNCWIYMIKLWFIFHNCCKLWTFHHRIENVIKRALLWPVEWHPIQSHTCIINNNSAHGRLQGVQRHRRQQRVQGDVNAPTWNLKMMPSYVVPLQSALILFRSQWLPKI